MVVTQGFFMLCDSGIVVWAGVEAGMLVHGAAATQVGGAFGDAVTLGFYSSMSRWAWNDYKLYLGAAATPGVSRSYEMCRHIVRHSSTNRL